MLNPRENGVAISPDASGAWLKDGRIFLTTGDAGIYAVASGGGRIEEFVTRDLEQEQDLHNAAPLPGSGVVFVRHNLDGINALGVWRDGEPFFVAPMADSPSVSADGTLVYLAGGSEAADEEMVLVDRRGELVKVLGRQPSFWPFPTLSPDLDFAVCSARGRASGTCGSAMSVGPPYA